VAANISGPVFTATATGAGGRCKMHGPSAVIVVSGETSAGAGAATVVVQASAHNDPDFDATSGDDAAHWFELGTVTLTLGTTVTADKLLVQNAHWSWLRFNVTAISGTGGTVTAYVSQAR
jgi:hypothetical protein